MAQLDSLVNPLIKMMNKTLIEPHGGKLVNCYLLSKEREIVLENAHTLPRLILSQRNLADLECIVTGVYSPLDGFIGEQDYYTIIKDMRLSSGFAWSIPVTLQIPELVADNYKL